MLRLDDIRKAVAKAASSWPQIMSNVPVDPNPIDILYLADSIRVNCNLTLDDSIQGKMQTASIVEMVEKMVLGKSPNIVRFRSPEQLINEIIDLGSEIIKHVPGLGSQAEAITKSLYLWYGCLMMSKLCREVDALGCRISNEHRLNTHFQLMQQSNTNIWIRTGVISTRAFLDGRKQVPADEWIPDDSPYWE